MSGLSLPGAAETRRSCKRRSHARSKAISAPILESSSSVFQPAVARDCPVVLEDITIKGMFFITGLFPANYCSPSQGSGSDLSKHKAWVSRSWCKLLKSNSCSRFSCSRLTFSETSRFWTSHCK